MNEHAVNKYLQNQAEPLALHIATRLASLDLPVYQQCLVIPAYQENDEFLYRLPPSDKKYLAIIVINQSDSSAADAANIALAKSIQRNFSAGWTALPFYDGIFHGEYYDVLLVDCFSAGRTLDLKAGVGLARKLGADIACQLITTGKVQSPWIFNTDADTYLPDDYFSIDTESASAVVYPFRHGNPQEQAVSLAMRLYEFSLHYYVAGLCHANSPYAFSTIGSCIAFDYRHYCKVRGFPKRNAGEDFYLLNKINKTGSVKTLTAPYIRIAERLSARVPFGTGPALVAINELDAPRKDYRFYHPNSFLILKALLQAVTDTAEYAQEKHNLTDMLSSTMHIRLGTHLLADSFDANAINELLATLGFSKALTHAQAHSKDSLQFLQHFQHWFDGFRTLKCIHYLREQHFPSIAFDALVAEPAYAPLAAELLEAQLSIESC